MISESDVNVLLLGESGAGKSTFINSLANYERCPTLQEALLSPLQLPIPVDFTIVDDDYKEHRVLDGADEYEPCESGSSTTKDPTEYVFQMRDGVRLRIIDSPGVGDSRGLAQDVENVRRTMEFAAAYGHINAVLFLLKTNVSVLNEYFKYCITYLLSRLEPAVLANVVFVITHTRSTFYRPGDTLAVVRLVLEEQKPLHIPCHKGNVYCLDNEAFKYLVAYKRGVRFHDHEMVQFESSWRESAASCRRLLDYMVGADGGGGLRPCRVHCAADREEIVKTSEARMDFLVDLYVVLHNNLSITNKLRIAGFEMGQLFFVKGIRGGQAIVCNCRMCLKAVQEQDIMFQVYAKKCHEPCNCNAHTDPSKCAIFKCSKDMCSVCSCKWENHSKITYEITTRLQELPTLSTLEDEMNEVVACFAIISSALKTNDDWLDHRIEKFRTTDIRRVRICKRLKRRSEEHLQNGTRASLEDIHAHWEVLKKLRWSGEAINEAFDCKLAEHKVDPALKATVLKLMEVVEDLHTECVTRNKSHQDLLTHSKVLSDYQTKLTNSFAVSNSTQSNIVNVLATLQGIKAGFEHEIDSSEFQHQSPDLFTASGNNPGFCTDSPKLANVSLESQQPPEKPTKLAIDTLVDSDVLREPATVLDVPVTNTTSKSTTDDNKNLGASAEALEDEAPQVKQAQNICIPSSPQTQIDDDTSKNTNEDNEHKNISMDVPHKHVSPLPRILTENPHPYKNSRTQGASINSSASAEALDDEAPQVEQAQNICIPSSPQTQIDDDTSKNTNEDNEHKNISMDVPHKHVSPLPRILTENPHPYKNSRTQGASINSPTHPHKLRLSDVLTKSQVSVNGHNSSSVSAQSPTTVAPSIQRKKVAIPAFFANATHPPKHPTQLYVATKSTIRDKPKKSTALSRESLMDNDSKTHGKEDTLNNSVPKI